MPAETAEAAEAAESGARIADPALLTHWVVLGKLTLPGRPEHVRDARHFVARLIGAGHLHADAALLLTSELVTNAVLHSKSGLPGGTVELLVAAKMTGLLISVSDDGSDTDAPKSENVAGGETGNGLVLVETLADDWGYASLPESTVVWFQLNTHRGHYGER